MMDSRRDMPEKTLFEILLWLPVVSLLRFRSVCKSWFSLINDSTFTTQHLHLRRGNDSLIASYHLPFVYGSHFYLLSGNRYEVHTNLGFKEQWYTYIGRNVDCEMDQMVMVTSCNGIICLQSVNSGYVLLWNPALKQMRHLPKSSIHKPAKTGDTVEDSQDTIIGFGHDAKTNDYKVVRIIWHWDRSINQVEVYSLRTSSWKIIHKNDVLPCKFRCYEQIHATREDGTYFWVAEDDILVSFDLKDEVFETMLLPKDGPDYDSPYALNFLNDKLVYIKGVDRFRYVFYYEHFEIWMLGEFGVNESWNKTHKIRSLCDPNYMAYMIGFSKDGELIFINDDRLKLYNLVTREIYPPTVEECNYELGESLQYNESLVSIK